MHKQQGWPQAWEYCQAKLIQTLVRASQGVDWSWSQCIKSHHAQTSSGKGLPSHFWTRDNVRSILPGLWRKRTGLLLSLYSYLSFILIFIKSTVDCIAHFISLHVLLLILFYFIFYLFFILFLPIFIYTLLCYVSSFILFFCTVHWADPSWPTFHYWLYPVWLCMWQIIKNLEP